MGGAEDGYDFLIGGAVLEDLFPVTAHGSGAQDENVFGEAFHSIIVSDLGQNVPEKSNPCPSLGLPGFLGPDGAHCRVRVRFTQLEWIDVVRLPVVVFFAVALADGRADAGELKEFQSYLVRTTHVDPLLKQLCGELAEQGSEALQLSDRERDFKVYLPEVAQLLEDRLSPQERRTFLAGLLCLGHHVADATGGFWGLGNRVSALESARLEEVSSLLKLPQLLDPD